MKPASSLQRLSAPLCSRERFETSVCSLDRGPSFARACWPVCVAAGTRAEGDAGASFSNPGFICRVCSETVNMDFSRLHTYAPPQCVPENTGYTYALSSSYSSDALDFETEHKLDPVFDSPRMSRRSLRLVTTARAAGDGAAGDGAARLTRQRGSAQKSAFSVHHSSRRALSSAASRSGSAAVQAAACLRPPVLDESLIREQTKVAHFWGLDDDGDLKGGNKVAIQGNGEVAAGAAEAAGSNGYTHSDCSRLSEHRGVPTTSPAARGPASRIYSRDRSQKPGRAARRGDGIWSLAVRTSASCAPFLVQLFQVVLMKLNYASENYRLKSCESKSYESESHDSKAHSSHCVRTDASARLAEDGHLRANGAPLCDDCKGRKRLETHVATRSQRSRPGGLAGTLGLALAHAGQLSRRALRRAGAAGWHVSRMLLLALCWATAAPGKAASEVFWWLGTGWYQLVTLISWLNVFLLTRCLRNICKFLIVLIPLLLLLDWTHSHRAQRVDGPGTTLTPAASHPSQPLQVGDEAFHWHRMSEVERQVATLSGRCRRHDEELGQLVALLQKLQARVDLADGSREWGSPPTDYVTLHQEHELRISSLEDVLGGLTERSEAIRKELEQARLRAASGAGEEQHLPALVGRLEQELERLKADLSSWQRGQASCETVEAVREKVDVQIRETLRLIFSGDEHDASADWLLQKLSAQFVSKDDVQALLRDLELQVLRNITHHISVTRQMPTSETVVSAVSGAGVPGITEAQARVIVNNALKLYSQDKTGMVDFALESGGGSVLSTRCSETYETKTALISLFGVPLWYFSQSPRVAIQPDIYPGNCWAFRGSQGYLVVRLSMTIRPTAFTLEHIPKALSPTGSITSAPKDFAVYGLENEYQEEGQPLGRFIYDQEGESLQMFAAPKKTEGAFQIVELRIFSNWGHPEYTCLYRFRVHGEPIE
ncbi:SUN domain-containing protein 1 isoform X5 [Ovis aries]|uniref:SUN domain-containing protein 1 isoform X5 n=2 Tax=Ovis aries TaxID=9940 RepID=UPI001C2E6B42|nr:SUN domain-containing protein 1 isoform X5 [Ovis aries]